MTEMIRIRESREEDLPVLAELEQSCFSDPIPEEQLRRFLQADNQYMITAEQEGQPAGYLSVQFVLDEGYINNVAVSPQLRRRGIGDRLLAHTIAWAQTQKLAFLTLEVRESNASAIALYRKNGFEPVGLRKNYYEKPKENAILMTKSLK